MLDGLRIGNSLVQRSYIKGQNNSHSTSSVGNEENGQGCVPILRSHSHIWDRPEEFGIPYANTSLMICDIWKRVDLAPIPTFERSMYDTK